MARIDPMPPLGFLFEGRLPIFILPYSNSGVARRKYSTNWASLKTMDRYASVATTAISSKSVVHAIQVLGKLVGAYHAQA